MHINKQNMAPLKRNEKSTPHPYFQAAIKVNFISKTRMFVNFSL